MVRLESSKKGITYALVDDKVKLTEEDKGKVLGRTCQRKHCKQKVVSKSNEAKTSNHGWWC
ncbi:hypothetical protein [Wolbachia endosymbiont of Mansonella perstans]|uniref:hypothetical protein n=1 Tax=Wolbachia endosymbiont of Mansonella perstans TaxID=229526 RepID=UPI001CE08951|nr:hypothetical protein [Wolbachia endosymbiont of Mansonella perstans]MCA4773765.1 hypothetical protein [Wolbachia endosymbiont of Mansonella perstans]